MNLSCPACNKLNDLGADGPLCRRCGCDLTLLAATLRAATERLLLALETLEAGHWDEALSHAEQSWVMRHSSDAARTAFLAACGLGDPASILVWRRRAREPVTSNQ